MTRLVAGIFFAALLLGCGADEKTSEPARAPDAGHRFVEQPGAEEADGAQKPAERARSEQRSDAVDAAELRQAVPETTEPPAPPAGPQ